MTILTVPDDILRYVIFPFIPKADRFDFNQALPPSHRVIGKLGKRVLEFEILFTTYTFKKLLFKCLSIYDIPVKRDAILNFIREYKRYAILFQYSEKIRSQYVKRINFLIDDDVSTDKTTDYVHELMRLRESIFASMITHYPYKGDMLCTNGNLPSY